MMMMIMTILLINRMQTKDGTKKRRIRKTSRGKRIRKSGKVRRKQVCLLVGWLLNVPATCQCISGTDPLRQLYVLPH